MVVSKVSRVSGVRPVGQNSTLPRLLLGFSERAVGGDLFFALITLRLFIVGLLIFSGVHLVIVLVLPVITLILVVISELVGCRGRCWCGTA